MLTLNDAVTVPLSAVPNSEARVRSHSELTAIGPPPHTAARSTLCAGHSAPIMVTVAPGVRTAELSSSWGSPAPSPDSTVPVMTAANKSLKIETSAVANAPTGRRMQLHASCCCGRLGLHHSRRRHSGPAAAAAVPEEADDEQDDRNEDPRDDPSSRRRARRSGTRRYGEVSTESEKCFLAPKFVGDCDGVVWEKRREDVAAERWRRTPTTATS